MRNRFLDRLLIFCYVVLTAVITVATALRAFDIDLAQRLFDGLSVNAPGILWKLIVTGVAAIVILLGLLTLVEITPSRKKRATFITISGDETGEVRVAIPAMKDMVRQALGKVEGLSEMNVDIMEHGDSVSVEINLDVKSTVHVPTLTMNMQRAVRTHIQTSCGIAVKNVTVVVRNVIPVEGAEAVIIETGAPAAEVSAAQESAVDFEAPRAEIAAASEVAVQARFSEVTEEESPEEADFPVFEMNSEAEDISSEDSDEADSQDVCDVVSDEGEEAEKETAAEEV